MIANVFSYTAKFVFNFETSASVTTGTARNFVREEPVTDVFRVQSLTILHKDHCHSLISGLLQQDMTSNIFYQSA